LFVGRKSGKKELAFGRNSGECTTHQLELEILIDVLIKTNYRDI